jgi:hypothetical protein
MLFDDSDSGRSDELSMDEGGNCWSTSRHSFHALSLFHRSIDVTKIKFIPLFTFFYFVDGFDFFTGHVNVGLIVSYASFDD